MHGTEVTPHAIEHHWNLLSLLVSVLLCNTWTNFLLFVRLFFVLFFHLFLLLLLRWWWGCILLGNLLCHQLRVYPRFSTMTIKRSVVRIHTAKTTSQKASISATGEEYFTTDIPHGRTYLMLSTTVATKQDVSFQIKTLVSLVFSNLISQMSFEVCWRSEQHM